MPTTTTTYSFNKPVVGADEDDWGGYLNGNWDSVDDLLDGTTPVTGIDINSGTLDGVTIGGTTAGAGTFTTLTANTSITGTLATAAQTNITSVGTLTSLDVGGTVTADGLTVDGATGITVRNDAAGASEPKIVFDNDTFAGANHAKLQTGNGGLQLVIESPSTSTYQNRHQIVMNGGGGDDIAFKLSTDNGSTYKTQLYIDNNDISFYEDTGTTAKFFWDASAERLGIGTTTPSDTLHVKNAGGSTYLKIENGVSAERVYLGSEAGKNSIYSQNSGAGDLPLAIFTGNNERMRIDSSGNVGIGTSSPDELLHIHGATQSYIKLTDDDSGQGATDGALFAFDGSSATQYIWNYENGPTVFATNGSERMRIDSSGNLLVGSTNNSPATNNVAGSSHGSLGNIQASVDGNPCLFVNRKSNDGDIISFRKDGSAVGSISVTSSATAYNTSSDYRLKENVVDLTDATTRLKQLEPKRFNFIADADTTVDGFLAHEVQTVVPEAITGTHNEVDADGNPVYQGIDQSKLVPLLVATIKELEARITALEAN